MFSSPVSTAQTIRVPSTANLQVDSSDRLTLSLSGERHKIIPETGYSPVWDFTITRPNSIFNGFFTRIGTTEVVLNWDTPNISSALGNNKLTVDISGAMNTYITDLIFPNQFAISAACIYDGLLQSLNDLSGVSGYYFTFTTTNPLRPCTYQLQCFDTMGGGNVYFRFYNTTLAVQLGLYRGLTTDLFPKDYELYFEPTSPDLRAFNYIDFVSPSLTYAQDVKDASTNIRWTDVLCRFYFSYDQENTYDKYNFPIYMGYAPFSLRRLFNPPKQIKWDMNLPVGQLQFQVYGEAIPLDLARNRPYQVITLPYFNTSYLMTLQLSED